ncbi:hypothetical protein QBC37DRAFT_451409 [Rhypophila decipiens]|uniref:DUF7580 domain-containing protein n=1 Tax=Rhypophila decipiens TaxID=261697 RepID=A0AAN6Y2L7_9PEZI|nr:hypothetical protein QBC37DRAFT_451409 [Rhypophila decipiens]
MGKSSFLRLLKKRVQGRFSSAQQAEITPQPPSSSSPFGLHEWHACPDATVDICFIHGLTGDRDRTWTADIAGPGASKPWPQTLLPAELGNARILTYGYDAYFTSAGVSSGNRLVDHARNLMAELTTDREAAGAETRTLIFVVHSLGGLVCKKAILLSQDNRESRLQTIFKCTKGIIFMGTPHQGSWMASWAKIPISALGVVKSINSRLLKILEPNQEFLESIQDDFVRLLRRMSVSQSPMEITCFYEELPMPVIGNVVSRESANFGSEYNAISIHANHRDMVRFKNREDRGFIQVLGLLKKWQYDVSLGPSMKQVLVDARHLLDIFEDCRGYIHELPGFQEYNLVFNKTILRLGSCKLRIEEAYTQLLERLDAPRIESLMKRNMGWDDLQLQTKLRIYMKDDWPRFQKTVSELERNLSYFKGKMSINGNFLSGLERDWNQTTAVHEFLQKWAAIQRSSASHMYERLVRKICRDVDHLFNFVPSQDGELEERTADLHAQPAGESSDLVTAWLDLRDHTWNLCEKLTHIWLYNCIESTNHQAQIRLELPAASKSNENGGPSFNYSFQAHDNTSKVFWHDVTVSSKSKAKRSPSPAQIDRKGKKKARFHDPDIKEFVIDGTGSTATVASEIEIFNICQTIEQNFRAGDYMGCLSCGNFDYLIYSEAGRDRELVPLWQLLPFYSDGKPIPTRQKRCISLALATSLLLLYDTPWLPDQYWTLDDVYMDPEDPTRLYRRQVFSRDKAPTDSNGNGMGMVDNQNMFCLAVALLELTFGQPLANFQPRHSTGSDDRLVQLITAKRLMKNIRKHEEERFTSVLIKCMNPPSSSPTEYDFSFGNEAFRRQYIRDVLLPLYQDVKALSGN